MRSLILRYWLMACINLVMISCLAQGNAPPRSSEAPGPAPSYRPGELLVKFKAGVTDDRLAAMNERLGANVIQRIEPLSVYRLAITGPRSVEEMVAAYAALPDVDYAEPNYLRRAAPDASTVPREGGPSMNEGGDNGASTR